MADALSSQPQDSGVFVGSDYSAQDSEDDPDDDLETDGSSSPSASSSENEDSDEGGSRRNTSVIYKEKETGCYTESQRRSMKILREQMPKSKKKSDSYTKSTPSQSICKKCGTQGHYTKQCPRKPHVAKSSEQVRQELAGVQKALLSCGHEDFLPEQAKIIKRIVKGQSTLVVLPRDSGKSLCYQLPAYLSHQRSKSIGLVISPIIALMEDQITQLPRGIKGVYLHHEQIGSEREAALKRIMDKDVSVVLMTPEQLMKRIYQSSSHFSLYRFPPIAFVCFDEVHLISENDRPSYRRLFKVVQDKLDVKCILGLTATATQETTISLADKLGIGKKNIIQHDFKMPLNLKITVSCDEDRKQALVSLLQSTRLKQCKSIIIYCREQIVTEEVGDMLEDELQGYDCEKKDSVKKGYAEGKVGVEERKRKGGSGGKAPKRRKLDWSVKSYHAGLPRREKTAIMDRFMKGELRILVTTIAFGMGINKDNVQAVIHYNIPKSIESYVQQIGRAGRDGNPAHCHVFTTKAGDDVKDLAGLFRSDTPKSEIISRLMMYIAEILPEEGTHTTVDLPVKEVRGLLADIPETRVQTLLCCLEEVGGIHIQSPLTEAFIKVVCCEDFHDKVVITKFTDLTVTLLELQEQSKIQELGCLYEALKCIACGSFEECFDYDQTHIVREAIENYFISSSDDRIDASSQTHPQKPLPKTAIHILGASSQTHPQKPLPKTLIRKHDASKREPKLSELMNMVGCKTTKWREIGCELNLSDKLDEIAIDEKEVKARMRCVFKMWKDTESAPYEWKTIIKALKATQVGKKRLAEDLKKYLQSK